MTIDLSYVHKNFAKNEDLTRDISMKLHDGRQVTALLPNIPIVGRLLHKVRYLLSNTYKTEFDLAAQSYLNERKVTQIVPNDLKETLAHIEESAAQIDKWAKEHLQEENQSQKVEFQNARQELNQLANEIDQLPEVIKSEELNKPSSEEAAVLEEEVKAHLEKPPLVEEEKVELPMEEAAVLEEEVKAHLEEPPLVEEVIVELPMEEAIVLEEEVEAHHEEPPDVELAPAIEEPTVPDFNVHTTAFLAVMEKSLGLPGFTLLNKLLSINSAFYKKDICSGFSEKDNTYTLTFPQSLHMHIQDKDESFEGFPKEGVIFTLNKDVEFTAKGNEIEFKKGFECYGKIPMIKLTTSVAIKKIAASNDHFDVTIKKGFLSPKISIPSDELLEFLAMISITALASNIKPEDVLKSS